MLYTLWAYINYFGDSTTGDNSARSRTLRYSHITFAVSETDKDDVWWLSQAFKHKLSELEQDSHDSNYQHDDDDGWVDDYDEDGDKSDVSDQSDSSDDMSNFASIVDALQLFSKCGEFTAFPWLLSLMGRRPTSPNFFLVIDVFTVTLLWPLNAVIGAHYVLPIFFFFIFSWKRFIQNFAIFGQYIELVSESAISEMQHCTFAKSV